MDFKTFSREFMNINGWELDSEGRYMIFRKPLSVWDSEKDQDTKFTSLKEMWDYCYDGMPHNSTVCISNVGVMQNKENSSIFMKNMEEMIQILEPSRIIFYGSIPKGYDFKDVEVVSVKSSTFLNQKREKKVE